VPPHSPVLHLRPLALAIAFALLGTVPTAVVAQSQTASPHVAQTVRDYDLPAGPLAATLNRISREAGIALTAGAATLENRNAAAVRGRMRTEQALERALTGSGLELVPTGPGSYTLRLAAPSPDAAMLSAVTVSAAIGTATERTGSYVARSTSTATRLELSQRETPQSVSVVTRAMMDDFSLTNVNDMLASVTGVNVELVESDRTYFSIRGFEVSNFLVDGIGLPFATGDQLGDIDTAPYDRVEVLRGANGLLASIGNPAGTVNFVRKRPTRELQASAAVTFGSWQNRRIDGDFSSALDEDGRWRGRLIVAAQEKDSHLDRYSLDKKLFSAIVEHDIGTDTLLAIGHSQQRNRPKGTLWGALPLRYSDGTPTHYERSASSAAKWAYWNSDDTQTFAELNHRLNDRWQAKATLLRRSLESDGELFYVYGTPDRETGTGLFSWPSKYGHTERQWTADVNLTGTVALGGHEHELVFGISRSKSDNWLHSRDDDTHLPLTESEVLAGSFPRPAFDVGLSDHADFVNRRDSIYAAGRFSLTSDLKLLAGANLSRVTSSGVQYGAVHDYRETRTTPYLSVVYDIDRHHSAYASYAEIFNPQHQITQSGSVLEPIEGRNLEAGIKGEWFERRLNGSLAVFRTDQKNTAEYDGFSAGRSYYRGVNASSQGFEIDMAGRIGSTWDINAGYTQFSLKDEDSRDVRTHVPRRTLRLSAVARVPGLHGFKAGATVKWQSEIHRTEASAITSRQDAYALLDLMASYDISPTLNVTAKLNNATDRKYLSSLFWSQSFYGAPRNASLTLNWKY